MIQLRTVYQKLTLDLNTNRLKVKRWEKLLHANSNQKRRGMAILKESVSFPGVIWIPKIFFPLFNHVLLRHFVLCNFRGTLLTMDVSFLALSTLHSHYVSSIKWFKYKETFKKSKLSFEVNQFHIILFMGYSTGRKLMYPYISYWLGVSVAVVHLPSAIAEK